MQNHIPTRSEAFELVKQYIKTESLINHALAVEAVMRYYAQLHGQDVEKWGVIGLVHDLDWEVEPERHTLKTREILEAANWPEDYIRAVESHAFGSCTEVVPLSLLEKTLYAIDELTGLITATALVRPSKSIMDVKVKSVKRTWKTKNFAAGCHRETIEKGAEMLGLERGELIEGTLTAMQGIAEELGLKGVD
ncbi:HDIG domain-containing protein [Ancylomarina salipaludis]|uniref:HDIG domain-containing protein n=2 Tax=Ancylomarina salipaludis TaxID=2501299 RepID=A0A4Q1JJE0_9BACT|nr:HDIG domain-containing protein [Ancylomarina salipaludis]